MSKPDYHGARHDAEVEAIEAMQRERHLNGECAGAPYCGYCLDEIDERIEKENAEGYYDSRGHWVK